MKKEYLCIIGILGATSLGTAIGENIFGALAGFGIGCIVAVICYLDLN